MMQPDNPHIEGLIALGSNLSFGSLGPKEIMRSAVARMGRDGLGVKAISSFYRTPAFPEGSGPDFINAVAQVKSGLEAAEILRILHRIEAELGRVRGQRWAARACDLDLVSLGGAVLPDEPTVREWMDLEVEAQMQRTPPGLILPHPRVQDRAFVLVPLAEVAPEWVHPVTGQGVAEMIAALPHGEVAAIERLEAAI